MKKVKVIYNPSSGRQVIQKRVDTLCTMLMDSGFVVGRFATRKKNDAMEETIKCCSEDWDILVACGGDGTVNEVASGIANGKRKIPVAILPAGTVNDFANYMNFPRTAKEICEMIIKGDTVDVDLGMINGNYFVNVAAGGLLTNVAHQVPSEVKTVLGRTAYYMEGIKELPRQMYKAIKVNIESDEHVLIDEEIFLFLITNSPSIGGFKKFAPKAEVMDGLLDVLIIKKSDIQEALAIFLSILRGEHINHPNVLYFKTKKLIISSKDDVQIDLDGEYGGVLPASFEVVPKSLRVFVP